MPHFATERGCGQFAWLQGLLFSKPKPRKGVKGPWVPCGVSFPSFFPLVERKRAVGDRTRHQHSRECVSVSAEDNPPASHPLGSPLYTRGPLGAVECRNLTRLASRTYALTRPRGTKGFECS